MTNEEKSREISNKHKQLMSVYKAALEMAAWKEEKTSRLLSSFLRKNVYHLSDGTMVFKKKYEDLDGLLDEIEKEIQ